MVDKVITAGDVSKRCRDLKGFWRKRNVKFKKWYSILKLKDELAQDNMESFVSNDPRTSYNFVLNLMAKPEIPHKVPIENLTEDLIPKAAQVEQILETAWHNIFRDYRKSGRKSWKKSVLGLMLTTGWYSVFAMVNDDGFLAEIWNPADVFPLYGETGLIECAHIISLSKKDAERLIAIKGWPKPSNLGSKPVLYDHWGYDEAGSVVNTIVLDSVFMKHPEADTQLKAIPVFVSPLGGLPDFGSITEDDSWTETIGESFVSVNAKVYDSYNRQWTFAQQMLRDTANPRWLELSQSGKILKPTDMFKRGAVFKGQPGDDVRPLPVQALPVELRADRIDMETMIQRGGVPWILQGGVSATMSAMLMTQVAAAAEQSFSVFHEGIIDLMSDIDNFWLEHIYEFGFSPGGKPVPRLPDGIEISAKYRVEIPGDLAARATISRMLSPRFELSETTTMNMMFPEIKDPIGEQAKARANNAQKHPVYSTITLIMALRKEAAAVSKRGDAVAAALYEKAADAAEAALAPPQQQGAPPPEQNVEEVQQTGNVAEEV